MTTMYGQSNTLFKDLAALLTGQLFLPDDTAYEQVRQLWSGRAKTQPAARCSADTARVARCLTVQECA
ncbi:hypothetical protein [Leptolyngbya sp. NIES-2104]|uniref:hypothetical protein n=1 Tax=Leptolyngbya sp. NIES-2104 TaxID=1552121 RepID=UPI000B127BC1|nr:hypothetical protein [Leptolyngbya sp. NIES-2104]